MNTVHGTFSGSNAMLVKYNSTSAGSSSVDFSSAEEDSSNSEVSAATSMSPSKRLVLGLIVAAITIPHTDLKIISQLNRRTNMNRFKIAVSVLMSLIAVFIINTDVAAGFTTCPQNTSLSIGDSCRYGMCSRGKGSYTITVPSNPNTTYTFILDSQKCSDSFFRKNSCTGDVTCENGDSGEVSNSETEFRCEKDEAITVSSNDCLYGEIFAGADSIDPSVLHVIIVTVLSLL